MRLPFFVAVLLLLLACPLQAQDTATKPAKFPIPDQAARTKASAVAQDIFGADMRKAATAEDKAALIAKVVQAARDSKGDLPSQYVLYELARAWAVTAGDVAGAASTIDEQAAIFAVDAWALRLELLGKWAESSAGSAVAGAQNVAQTWIEQALAEDKYDIANKLGQAEAALARRSTDSAALTRATETLKGIKEAQANFAEATRSLDVLAVKPEDPQANLAYGKYHCLNKGDWNEGLPYVAKGADADWKSLAEKELKAPAEADKQAAVGDGWWDLSLKQSSSLARERMKQHACFWYRQCVDKVTGLEKLRVDKCLAEPATEVKSKPKEVSDGTTAALPGNMADKIDLTSKAVEIKAGLDTVVNRFKDHLLVLPNPAFKPDTDGKGPVLWLIVVLGKLTFAEDSRIRWRLEVPGEADTRGSTKMNCWPLMPKADPGPPAIEDYAKFKTVWFNGLSTLQNAGYKCSVPSHSIEDSAFRKDGNYELCFEKVGDKLAAWADTTKLLEVELTAEQMTKASAAPIQLRFAQNWRNRTFGAKITLLELTMGKNLAPLAPPRSQPDSK